MPRLEQYRLQDMNAGTTNKWHEIRTILSEYLSRCGIPPSKGLPFTEFEAECWDVARGRGYDLEAIGPYMQPSIAIAALAYAHVQPKEARIFVALYTAFAIYIDDACEEGLDRFHERLAKGLPQESKTLDDLLALLPEALQYWGPVACGFIYTAIVDYASGTMIDKTIVNMKVHKLANSYAGLMRDLSGLSKAYTVFMFSKDLPVTTYIQAMPEMMFFINHTNDILSFYKEELVNEDINFVSLKAKHHRVSKVTALQMLTDGSGDAFERASQILKESSPEAYEPFAAFAHGYVEFHFASERRYKLDQLEL